MDETRHGGCACGAVRFTARGTPKFICNCHCADCRRCTAAAFSTWVGYDTPEVDWTGKRSVYHSSPDVSRGYCAQCGTPLSYSGKQWSQETHLLIGTFDLQQDLVPTGDSMIEDHLPWVHLPTMIR